MPALLSRRIMVTGGSGFIGRAVVHSLIDSGIKPLVTYRRRALDVDGSVDTAFLDVTDLDSVRTVLHKHRPQILIHLVGASLMDDPTGELCMKVNFEATSRLLDAAADAGVERAVILGSSTEYGANITPFDENMVPKPVSTYARSKTKATEYALELYDKTGFGVSILRPFTTYGPGQPSWMFVSQLITSAVSNRPFSMSDGVQKRDLVYVDDVAEAVLLTVESEQAAGHIINIASGKGTALLDLAVNVWETCRADPEKLLIGKLGSSGDDPLDLIADITLARRLLGWEPKTSLSSGLRSMINAIRDEIVGR